MTPAAPADVIREALAREARAYAHPPEWITRCEAALASLLAERDEWKDAARMHDAQSGTASRRAEAAEAEAEELRESLAKASSERDEARAERDMHVAALDALEEIMYGDMFRRSRDEMDERASELVRLCATQKEALERIAMASSIEEIVDVVTAALRLGEPE